VGLDAVVYRNRKQLQLGPDEKFAQVVPETGETYFENDEISRRHRDRLQAAHYRLGNITEISYLRDEVLRLGAPTWQLCSKVLYSGSHSVDFIAVNELPSLLQEIVSLQTSEPSKELRDFLDEMEGLIRVAMREGNPIVFV
jgi:hypothetical protein